MFKYIFFIFPIFNLILNHRFNCKNFFFTPPYCINYRIFFFSKKLLLFLSRSFLYFLSRFFLLLSLFLTQIVDEFIFVLFFFLYYFLHYRYSFFTQSLHFIITCFLSLALIYALTQSQSRNHRGESSKKYHEQPLLLCLISLIFQSFFFYFYFYYLFISSVLFRYLFIFHEISA